jgi:hypothetical protein
MRIWPLPALLTWLAAWALFLLLKAVGMPAIWAFCGAQLAASLAALRCISAWRMGFVAGGFPLSLLASGTISLPAWMWLTPLAGLLLIYPLRSWRDAPFFPTPGAALAGLAKLAPLSPQASVLEAGCGLGHGLSALRQEYPAARLLGLEWSWPLRLACAWRCPYAQVRQGDIWAHDWAGHDLVYLFQRPESMPRAAAKAENEMKPGSWLVSLEFEVPGWRAAASLQLPRSKPVWIYRLSDQPPTKPLRMA